MHHPAVALETETATNFIRTMAMAFAVVGHIRTWYAPNRFSERRRLCDLGTGPLRGGAICVPMSVQIVLQYSAKEARCYYYP